MTADEIKIRLFQGEDSATQFKRGPIGIAKLASELAAFTNAAGGVIFFGVEDDGTICGLSKADAKQLDSEVANASNDSVRPAIYPRTEFHTIDGKLILAVIVPEGVSKPYADKTGAFWTKAGADKRRVTAREELQRMLQKSLLIHADELPVPNTSAQDIDRYHLGEFLERHYKISSADVLEPGKLDLAQMLSNLGFANGSLLTLAGVMLFAKTPQRFAPVNIVKCVSFFGNSVAGMHYRDSEDVGGTIRDMYKATMAFIMRNLRHEQRGQNFNSIGIPLVPEEAISELVVNMFLHRDYFMSSPWRVFIFDDRIELHSPGCLPNNQDIAKIKSGVSVARNPILFTFATKEIPYRGIGSGIQRALELYPNIEFKNDIEANDFVSIVRYGGVNALPQGVNTPPKEQNTPPRGVNTPPKEQNTPPRGVNTPPSEAEKTVLELIREHPGERIPFFVELTGCAERTIERAIARLKSEPAKIEFRGAPKTGGYYILEGS